MATLLANQPRDFLLGPDNDIVVGTDLSWSTGIQAVAQSCRIAIQMFLGEWFLDLTLGIPYWQSILAQKPDAAIFAAKVAFRQALTAVDGVVGITQLDVAYVGATRAMTITWQVMTALGTTPVDSIAQTVSGGSA